VLLEGSIEETIASYVLAHNAQLVVMSTHGRGGVGRLLFGNVADDLIRELHSPVILVRPGYTVVSPDTDTERRILVPLDGSAVAEATIDRVIEIFGREGIELYLLQVVSMPLMLPLNMPAADQPALIERAVDAATTYLDGVAGQVRSLGVAVRTEVRLDEVVASVIFTCIDDQKPDLIAMATRGEGGINRAIFGSVADKVIRASTVPVMVWNPPEEAKSALLSRSLP
jgi:nucleotide-binding universal stress UspA family protein